MTINYAAYRRVSSDEQSESGNGLDTQEKRIKDLARTHGLHIAQWFTDDISGTIELGKRPDGARLVKAIKAGRIQGIILSKVNRLSRDFADCLTLIRDLTRQGIHLYSVDVGKIENEENIPMIFQAWTGQAERRDIVERTSEGRKRKAEKKQFVGVGGVRGTPYGYKRVGSGRDVSLIIDKVTSKIVREIYTAYNEGQGTTEIINSLNARHIPPPRSKAWSKINVLHILSNPMYKGVIRYSDTSYTDDKLQIISPSEWRAAEKNRARRLVHKPKSGDFLLSNGHLLCSCGSAMVGTTTRQGEKVYRYYQCWRHSDYSARDERRCTVKPIRANDVESSGLTWLVELALSQDKLRTLIHEMQSRSDNELEPIRARRQSLVEMVGKNEKGIARLTRLIADSDNDEMAKPLEAELMRLNELALGLKVQLAEADEEIGMFGIWATGQVTVESVQQELKDVWQFSRVPLGLQIDFSKIDRMKARQVINRYDLRVALVGQGNIKVSCAFGQVVRELEGVDTYTITGNPEEWLGEMNVTSYGCNRSAKLVLSEVIPIAVQ